VNEHDGHCLRAKRVVGQVLGVKHDVEEAQAVLDVRQTLGGLHHVEHQRHGVVVVAGHFAPNDAALARLGRSLRRAPLDDDDDEG
jgi:hypothetical protein